MDRYIGIDPDILKLPNVEFISSDKELDNELFLFTAVNGRRCFPKGNLRLKMIKDGEKVCDDFSHEQFLVVSQCGKKLLLSGCAHNGILNILDRYKEIFGSFPDYVISGFHMMKREGEYDTDEIAVIEQTANELNKLGTVFFSGHCTGQPAFEIMKKIMGDKLRAIHSGDEIIL
jgi:7,8-dihydropterin-6-yl-methyl-4-(beta-D-ribofuranosyl)aminobenzene 5'-phosphate synthase